MERRSNQARRECFEDLRGELKARIGHLCCDMAEPDFDALTVQMARIQLRYEPCSGVPIKDRADSSLN